MSLTLELPPALEAHLTREATEHHLSLPEYALALLARGHLPDPLPQNGAGLITYWEKHGVIGCLPADTDSNAYARALRHACYDLLIQRQE